MCTVTELFDELTYRSYAAQRRASPGVAPDRWRVLFPRQREYETRFTKETTNGVRSDLV